MAVAFALTLGLSLTACGDDDQDPTIDSAATDSTTTTASNESSDEHNDADVAFVREMIPHHEQAVEMAQLAATQAGSTEVLELAARIETAQQPAIDKMKAWLETWDEAAPMTEDHSGRSMSADDMATLEAAKGAEFDRIFLEMMIEHHRGAISRAEAEVAAGTFDDAVRLAQSIIEDQESEVVQMERLLEQLG